MFDLMDSGRVYLVIAGYSYSSFPIIQSLTNIKNVFFGEFGKWIQLSPIVLMSSVSSLIRHVPLMSIPSKISEMIIGWVTIVVAAFHSIRAGTNPSQKYSPMSRKPTTPTI